MKNNTTITTAAAVIDRELMDFEENAKERAIITEAVEATIDLLRQHWPQIKSTREDCGGQVRVGVNFAVDCTGKRPVIKTKIQFATKYADERESVVEDPSQIPLEMN